MTEWQTVAVIWGTEPAPALLSSEGSGALVHLRQKRCTTDVVSSMTFVVR